MWYSFVLMIGIIVLVISLVILRQSLNFLKKSERTIGTVVQVKFTEDSDGKNYTPIFSFKTKSNEEYTYTHIFSPSQPDWLIGEEATIAYNPNNPTQAKLLTYISVFCWTIGLMAVAMPLIVVGAGYHLAQTVLK